MTWTYRFQEAEIDALYLRGEFDLELVSHLGKWRLESAARVSLKSWPNLPATLRERTIFTLWLDDSEVQAQLTTEHDEERTERTR